MYEPDDEHPAIVIDNGSSSCRAGLAGEDAPYAVFPNLVGKRAECFGDDTTYVGDAAQNKAELLELKYPMDHGVVVNWDDMEKVWDHAFYSELKVVPEQHPVLITEAPLTPRGNREKMAQVLFETYNVPATFIALQPMLVLVSSGMHHGLMVEVGDSSTSVVPIYEGSVLFHSMRKVDFGGRDLTRHLQQLLYKKGHCFTTSAELEVVKVMKEKLCYVRRDLAEINHLSSAVESFQLPDGSKITLDEERYKCPEILFNPDNVFHSGKGLADIIEESISDSDIEARRDMYHMMVVSGGSTLFPGFPERLANELQSLQSQQFRIRKVWAAPERLYQKWIGGSILASLSFFRHAWVSRQEYDEYGPHVVNIRCYGE